MQDVKQHFNDGKIITTYDNSAIIEENKKLKIESDLGHSNRGDSKHLARVDVVTLMAWGTEDFKDPKVYLNHRLNKDPDVAAKFVQRIEEHNMFKIWKGKVNSKNILSGRS